MPTAVPPAPPPRPQTRGKDVHAKAEVPTTADYVSLRRAGDIICILPRLEQITKDLGRNVRLVVHRDFVPLLEGVSYVSAVPWDGEWEHPLVPANHFKAVNAQVCGVGLTPNMRTGNFARLAWGALGANFRRHMPLNFDRRNRAREKALAQMVFRTDKPKLLVKLDGHSSPFQDRHWVRQMIRDQFGGMAEIISLDDIVGERIYDLIGLMDRSHGLVTSDTSTLWLSHASACPSIQFVNGTGFSASPPRGNCIGRSPYKMARHNWPRISMAIQKMLTVGTQNEKMVCVYSDFLPANADGRTRQQNAFNTWDKLGARLHKFTATRTSKRIGDNRGMPYIRDMISEAFRSGDEGIAVLVNNDIIFGDDLRKAVLDSCKKHGCYWAYRISLPSQQPDGGADFFAMTRTWWHLHEHLIPDFLLGYYWFDAVLLRIMQWSGCREGKRAYYHQEHLGVRERLQSPGNRYNVRLATGWLTEHEETHEQP